jgi:hypothetical protein
MFGHDLNMLWHILAFVTRPSIPTALHSIEMVRLENKIGGHSAPSCIAAQSGENSPVIGVTDGVRSGNVTQSRRVFVFVRR